MAELIKIPLPNLVNWSVRFLLESSFGYNPDFDLVPISSLITKNNNRIKVENDKHYKRVKVKVRNGGVELRDELVGADIGTKNQFIVKKGQFIMSKIDARNGSFGIIPSSLNNAIVTNDFPTFNVNQNIIIPEFFLLITTTKSFIKFAQSCSVGSTNRQRIDLNMFLAQPIPLPSIPEQKRIIDQYDQNFDLAQNQENEILQLENEIEKLLFKDLGLDSIDDNVSKVGLSFVSYTDIVEWGYNVDNSRFQSNIYKTISLSISPELFNDAFRGKSPKYDSEGNSTILNQKCNRWNKLDLSYVKTVNDKWYNKIDKKFFTKEGDVLINSTGDGTIGRASMITSENENLLYDSHLLLLRLNKSKVNPLFFTYLFNSKYGQYQVESIKSAQSTKQTELGITNLKKIIFPLPSIQLQNTIANKLQIIFQRIEILKVNALNNRKDALVKFEQEIFSN